MVRQHATAVQVAPATVRALIDSWRAILPPHELAVVLQIAHRILADELDREQAAVERWAA